MDRSPTLPYRPLHRAGAEPADYSQWSIEELWQLASQLRVAGARNKSRRELIDFFGPQPKAAERKDSASNIRTFKSHQDKELS
ncbi:MAG: hypothetical protein EHM50_00625 [Lysobacterales bacterium]|nr:MAG: hypothetical protein EHM50_00625 [Xanthomonadales bacterium]